jgi:CDP-glucose 4,6-dehydratase
MEFSVGKGLRELPGPLLLTGHTGFKGTWLTFLLEYLDIPTAGYSLPAEKDSLFDRAKRIGAIPEVFEDVRNYEALEQFIDLQKPSAIIHMAAQPLVLKSYKNPLETFDVNVMGTANILDIAFKKDFVKAIVVVTTDKVYKNDNSEQTFSESDPLEGKDPYSASKVGTEAVVAAWQQIARVSGGPKMISVRAGNVIGGGDFAENRIVPDLIRGYLTNTKIIIRNPDSTRPWQHVLDPLFGYLLALEAILENTTISNLNFGPIGKSLSVRELVDLATQVIPIFVDLIEVGVVSNDSAEARILELDSSLSQEILGWTPKWEQSIAIKKTFSWWKELHENRLKATDLCRTDIQNFLNVENKKI